ncbi:tetratricopeptide repeat protein [bacterium]|nr:tetratricopeptide repeat protein [bacterium]
MQPNCEALPKAFWRSLINPMDQQAAALKDQAFEAYKKKNFKAAAQCFSECITLLDGVQDTLSAAEMRNNLSVVLLELKQPEEALSVLKGTDQIFGDASDQKRQAMALGNTAAALQALGKLPEALTTYEASADLFKEIGEKEMRALTLKKISDLQLKTGKQFQALASLEASYDQNEQKTAKEKVLKGFLGSLINKITHRS